MQILDLTFTNGQRCRCIVMDPQSNAEDEAGIRSIFCGRLEAVERRIPECPEKLPWKRDGSVFRLARFTLEKSGDQWRLTWPDGEVVGDREVVSAAVRENWEFGC